mgnify:CR=1 FL=1
MDETEILVGIDDRAILEARDHVAGSGCRRLGRQPGR